MALKSLEELIRPYSPHMSRTIVFKFNPHFNLYDNLTAKKDEYLELPSVNRNFGNQEDEDKIVSEAEPLIDEELSKINSGADKDRLKQAQKLKYVFAGFVKMYKDEMMNAAKNLCEGTDANICLVRYKYTSDEKLQARFELYRVKE